MDNHDIEVKVAHFINPNRFYLVDLTKPEQAKELRELEGAYQKLLKYPLRHDVCKGEIVCYKPPIVNKWIRCAVEDLRDNNKTILLWAIDYGKPAVTTKTSNLVRMPKGYQDQNHKNLIFQAGVTVVPAKTFLACGERIQKKVYQETWTQTSVAISQKYIKEAKKIFFRPEPIQDDEIAFGDLIFHNSVGGITKLSEKLSELDIAEREPNESFLKFYNRTITPEIERWNDNSRFTNIFHDPDQLKVSEIGDSIAEEAKTIKKLEIDHWANLENERSDIYSKVHTWQMRNEGIEPEDEFVDLSDIQPMVVPPEEPPQPPEPEINNQNGNARPNGRIIHGFNPPVQHGEEVEEGQDVVAEVNAQIPEIAENAPQDANLIAQDADPSLYNQPNLKILASNQENLEPAFAAFAIQPGPSRAHLQPGPSTAHLQPGPSTAHLQPGPSTAHPQPSPSKSNQNNSKNSLSPAKSLIVPAGAPLNFQMPSPPVRNQARSPLVQEVIEMEPIQSSTDESTDNLLPNTVSIKSPKKSSCCSNQ